MRVVVLLVATVLLAPLGCRDRDPARAAAERFLDLHYVEIDLPRAREEATGLARAKVEEEIRLTSGQEPPEAKPSVHYRFIEAQEDQGDERRGFVYEATISFDGSQFTRRVLLTVRHEEGVWRVTNFQESD